MDATHLHGSTPAPDESAAPNDEYYEALDDAITHGFVKVKPGTRRRGADAAREAQKLLIAATGATSPDEVIPIALGRPPVGSSHGPSPVLRARVSKATKDAVALIAERDGLSESSVVRQAIIEYVGRYEGVDTTRADAVTIDLGSEPTESLHRWVAGIVGRPDYVGRAVSEAVAALTDALSRVLRADDWRFTLHRESAETPLMREMRRRSWVAPNQDIRIVELDAPHPEHEHQTSV